MIPQGFPLVAPFRVDQVTQAPQLMAWLLVAQVSAALWIHLAAVNRRPRPWLAGVVVLLVLVVVFFTLGSWGNSDTTRFSHAMEWDLDRAPPEPLWVVLRPLVLVLPYRMALVHGLVVAGFALSTVLLAVAWEARAWAGWWSLLICCSPLLRGFLQNAHSRQALATLLLLPLLLQTARLVRLPRHWVGLGVLLSAATHNTFLWNLPMSLSPWLVWRLHPGEWKLSPAQIWREAFSRRRWPLLLVPLAAVGLLLLLAPVAWHRLVDYSQTDYYNLYPMRIVVGRLQRAMGLSLALACLQRRLDPRRLLLCPITQLLLLFGLLYGAIQLSISSLWLPQITSRLADGVGFFLLIFYLAWLHRYRAHWWVLLPLYVSVQYMLEGRILRSYLFACGRDDQFLCIPDRWPWQVRY